MKLMKMALALGLTIGCATSGALATTTPSFNFLPPNPIDLGNVSPGSLPDQTFYFEFNNLNPAFNYNLSTSFISISNLTGTVGTTYFGDLTGGSIVFSKLAAGPGSFEVSYIITLMEFNDCADNDDCTDHEAAYNSDTLTLRGNAVSAVPIPAALPLLASGVGAFGFIGWRRKKRKTAIVNA